MQQLWIVNKLLNQYNLFIKEQRNIVETDVYIF